MTLEVAIPDSSLEDAPDLRKKTLKVGVLARSFAIFKVERVHIYPTDSKSDPDKDAALMVKLLRYLDTPQYLRKQVFAHTSSLRHVGLLPPLRTKSHPLAIKVHELSEGDVRWGIQIKEGLVDLGLDKPIHFRGTVSNKIPTLFRVKTNNPVKLEVIDRGDIEFYFGYDVEWSKSFSELLEEKHASTRIVFSRNGVQFNHIADDVQATVEGTNSILAIFGSPRYGVSEIFRESLDSIKPNIEFWINSISNQGTETVRLEEAILTSLGLLNDRMGDQYTKIGYYS